MIGDLAIALAAAGLGFIAGARFAAHRLRRPRYTFDPRSPRDRL